MEAAEKKELGIFKKMDRGFWRGMRWLSDKFGKFPRSFASLFIVLLVINHGFLAKLGEASIEAGREYGFCPRYFDWRAAAWIIWASATFLFFTWQLYGLRDKLLRFSATVSDSGGQYAHAALLLFLSERRLNDKHDEHSKLGKDTYSEWEEGYLKAKEILQAVPRVSGKLANSEDWLSVLSQVCDAKGKCKGWNWQQPLRVILHELRKAANQPSHPLLEICILGSDASVKDYKRFKNLIEKFLISWPLGPVTISETAHEIQIIDIKDAAEKLGEMIGTLAKRYNPRRICVDATAGNKIYSIAVGLATLNKEMAFVYVDKSGTPKFYDANVAGVEFGME